jgi:hypothetical protein
MIFSSLSSSSFFCLGIILVIIGILGYLISRKFQEQNHKITTMCELVTTMAQDLQMLKMQNAVDKIQHSLHNQSISSGGNGASATAGNLTPLALATTETAVNGGSGAMNRTVDLLAYVGDSHKIVVSDDEASFSDSDESDTNEEDDDEEDDESSTLEEFQPDVFDDQEGLRTSRYEESDDNIEITELVELPPLLSRDGEEEQVEIFMIYSEVEPYSEQLPEVVETKHIELLMEPIEPVVFSSEMSPPHFEPSVPPAIVVNKLQADESPIPFVLEEDLQNNGSISATAADGFGSNTNNNQTNNAKPKKSTKQSRSMVSEEGNIENMEDFNGDYSKLNVTQLKNLVTYRGLSSHASKLKKTELLQLLAGGSVSGGGSIEVTEISVDM